MGVLRGVGSLAVRGLPSFAPFVEASTLLARFGLVELPSSQRGTSLSSVCLGKRQSTSIIIGIIRIDATGKMKNRKSEIMIAIHKSEDIFHYVRVIFSNVKCKMFGSDSMRN